MTKGAHRFIMEKIEGALHNLLNHEASISLEDQVRTQAEEQAFVHGYAQGWEGRQEADASTKGTGTGRGS